MLKIDFSISWKTIAAIGAGIIALTIIKKKYCK